MSRNTQHTVTIRAVDGSSQVFRVIGQSGQTMATQLDAAGKRSSAGLAQVDAAAKTTSASLKGLVTSSGGVVAAAASAGAGLATVAGLLADAARAAAEEQAEFDRLTASIEATGASFDRYAGSVDSAVKGAMALSFADDQAVNALNALVTTTGDAQKSVELLGLAMDVARGRNLDLSTAATLVGRVASGNVGILQRYGIAIDENATSTEALAALQQRFAGQADAYAQSQVGAAARVKNALDDLAESVGASTGDLQGLLLILPGLSSAYTLTAGAIGAFAASESAAAVATRGLIASMGPLGLLLAGASLAVGVLATKVHEAQVASDEARDPVDTLTQSILNLGNAADATAGKLAAQSIIEGWQQAAETAKKAADEIAALQEQQQENPSLPGLGILPDIGQQAIDNANAIQDQIDAQKELALTDQQLAQIEADLRTLRIDERQDKVALLTQADELIGKYNDQEISAQELYDAIEDLVKGQGDLARSMGVSADKANDLADAMANLPRGLEGSEERAYAVAKAMDIASAAIDRQTEAVLTLDDAERRMQQVALNSGQGFGLMNTEQVRRFHSELDSMAADQAEADRQAEEDMRAREDAYREAISAAQDLQQAEESLASAVEQRDDALADQADLAAAHEKELASITKERVQAQKAAEQDLAQTVRGIQQEREQNERDLAQTLRQLDQERAQVAADTERQLADLAQRRGEIQADAAQQAAEAERDWLETSRDNLAQQAELRQELQQTTAQAAQEWADLNRENLAQQRDIREELKRTLQEANIAFGREQDDIRREIAYTEEALKNAKGAGGGPYDAQAVADAKKRLEELNTELSRSTQDHKREEAAAKRDARDQEKDLEAERKQAMEDYHEKVRQAEADTAKRIQQLESDRLAAQQEFFRQQEDARNDAAAQLADLAAQERSILDEQGRKFAEIENEKRIAARDSAREQQKLSQETAKAERQAQAEILAAQKESAKQAREAELQYREDAAAAAERVRDAQAEVEDAVAKVNDQLAIVKKGAQGTVTVRTSQAMSNIAELRSELDDLLAQLNEDYNITLTVKGGDPEPLDGPVKNPNHIHGLHGVVVQPAMRAAMGRVVTVGEQRPETLILPFGSMVVPDGGERARASGGTTINYIFPNARFEMRTADIAKEISRQVATRER